MSTNGSCCKALAHVCQTFQVDILYAFGSRAGEALARTKGDRQALEPSSSDVDVGFKPVRGVSLSVKEKVRLAMALEDLFGVSRVDLVCLPEADPFLAANIVRGERLYARDEHGADEYDLVHFYHEVSQEELFQICAQQLSSMPGTPRKIA